MVAVGRAGCLGSEEVRGPMVAQAEEAERPGEAAGGHVRARRAPARPAARPAAGREER